MQKKPAKLNDTSIRRGRTCSFRRSLQGKHCYCLKDATHYLKVILFAELVVGKAEILLGLVARVTVVLTVE